MLTTMLLYGLESESYGKMAFIKALANYAPKAERNGAAV